MGAAISVCLPAAISAQPAACGSVGPAGNRRANQVRTAGWNDSSTRSDYVRPPTVSSSVRTSPLREWERDWVKTPEASFVALAGGEVVGVASLHLDPQRPET